MYSLVRKLLLLLAHDTEEDTEAQRGEAWPRKKQLQECRPRMHPLPEVWDSQPASSTADLVTQPTTDSCMFLAHLEL